MKAFRLLPGATLLVVAAVCGAGAALADSHEGTETAICGEKEYERIRRAIQADLPGLLIEMERFDWNDERSVDTAVDMMKESHDRAVAVTSCTDASLEEFLVGKATTEDHSWKEELAQFYIFQKAYGKSFKYRLMAARGGEIYAQLAVGMHYERGWGVEKDLVKGYAWFRVVDAQGLPMDLELANSIVQMSDEQISRGEALAKQYVREFEIPTPHW